MKRKMDLLFCLPFMQYSQLSTLTPIAIEAIYASFVYSCNMRMMSAEQFSNGPCENQNLLSHCWTPSHSQLSKSLRKSSSVLCPFPGFHPFLAV